MMVVTKAVWLEDRVLNVKDPKDPTVMQMPHKRGNSQRHNLTGTFASRVLLYT